MLEAGSKSDGGAFLRIRKTLRKLVGDADTNALLLATDGTHALASLGLVQGLTQLLRGEIDRTTFVRLYGHQSPHVFEVSYPRPGEDPHWIDQQLAGLRDAPTDVVTLLAFVVRAGHLTGHGEKLFFLSIVEILALLAGDTTALAGIGERQAIYASYAALPPYPALIRGHFDPFTWAADPQRRSDVFDDSRTSVPQSDTVSGFPGSPGSVEGRVRVVLTVEEGEQLQPGEVLVTPLTNIGWTPLFPRAAAVVTDVGAPLSHAAIVARELGIPAVVGCGNATMRLHTGDLVRVNGELGTVAIRRGARVIQPMMQSSV